MGGQFKIFAKIMIVNINVLWIGVGSKQMDRIIAAEKAMSES
jgi:hypothetical protein